METVLAVFGLLVATFRVTRFNFTSSKTLVGVRCRDRTEPFEKTKTKMKRNASKNKKQNIKRNTSNKKGWKIKKSKKEKEEKTNQKNQKNEKYSKKKMKKQIKEIKKIKERKKKEEEAPSKGVPPETAQTTCFFQKCEKKSCSN